MAQVKARWGLQRHHLSFHREKGRGRCSCMPLCRPCACCQNDDLCVYGALCRFYSDNPLPLTDEPPNGTPFPKRDATGHCSLCIGERDSRSLHISLIRRQQCSLDGCWKQWLDLAGSAPFQPLEPWEEMLLSGKESLQVCHALLVKSRAQGRHIHHPHLNPRLLFQFPIPPAIFTHPPP